MPRPTTLKVRLSAPLYKLLKKAAKKDSVGAERYVELLLQERLAPSNASLDQNKEAVLGRNSGGASGSGLSSGQGEEVNNSVLKGET